MPASSYDVVIAGGGLAGLALARQLRREAPDLRLLVAEKRTHPVREAAFKVGESTVEISAHYFARILDLRQHIAEAQLPKFGLRYFFPADDNQDIARRVELGPTQFAPVPSYQLDRGRFENHLLATNRELGVEVIDGSVVRDFALGDQEHVVTMATPDGTQVVAARWLIDASGRSGLIRRRLGLTREVGHVANACWFRVATRVRIDDWSADDAWRLRVPNGKRWLSTVHLMGRGYWVWLIPLGSGSTSIGIVADDTIHPFSRLNRFERALEWLREFEPQCAAAVEATRERLEDCLALQHFAYGCTRVYSAERWALTGEAGPFTDPFYSPGSDFIAFGNDFICELIRRERAGEPIDAQVEQFNTIYLQLYDAFLRLYEGQYPIMGNPRVMSAKVAWDNACYWGFPALIFVHRKHRDPAFMASVAPLMRRFFVLHARMQTFLRAWSEADRGTLTTGHVDVMWLDLQRGWQARLGAPLRADAALKSCLEENLGELERLARALQTLASKHATGLAPVVAPDPAQTPFDVGPLRLASPPAVAIA